jgi:predicted MPP superfamily phosphohydrolase
MDGLSIATSSCRDLKQQLEHRLKLEARHQQHPKAHGHGGFLVRQERVLRVLLKAALRLTGLYQRGLSNALRPVVRHLQFDFPNLPLGLEGFRILHLSDLHIDGIDGLTEVLVEQLGDYPVDLCVLTGDYRFEVYGSCEAVYPRMSRIVRSIRARHGILGILGNHDCAEIAIQLEELGVRMLINEAVQIGPRENRLSVLGIDDSYYYGCDDLAAAAEGVPDQDFKLLLAHTPELYTQASTAGIDLYLAGHTHAGQIRLPWLGGLILNADCPRDFTGGPWRYESMRGFTSAGVGCCVLPVRFGCPPEVVIVELCRSASSGRTTAQNRGSRIDVSN